MPNVVLEGMAAGLPVVTTHVEGTEEIIRNHVNGMLVPPESPPELAAVVTRLLTNPQQARELGLAAQNTVRKDFTWESTVEAYDRLYRDLLRT